MFKKLRIKITLFATLSIFAFLTLILGSINIYNFSSVASAADEVTTSLANSGGKFNDAPGGQGMGPGNPMGPENRKSMRYFTVSFEGNNGSIVAYEFTSETVTQEGAISWAKSIKDSGKDKGWSKIYYRYRVYTYSNKTYVSLIDQGRELNTSYRFLFASLIGGGSGILISGIIIFFVSKLMIKPLEESDKKQKAFISEASHELKTPITIISANAEILEATQGNNESIEAINNQTKRLSSMVKKLNSMAKLDETIKLEAEIFDLSNAVNEVAESFIPAFKNSNKELNLDIANDVIYKGDEGKIRDLISIILDNAHKYSLNKASLSLIKEGERITIIERNDAKDLPEGNLNKYFSRFYRGDNVRSGEIEGSGLGLSIAKSIVDKINGRINVENKDGDFQIKIEL